MILDFASGFIEMGESTEEKQVHLDIACTAWNIAVLPAREREKAIKRYFKKLKRESIDKKQVKLLKEDMQELIRAKNELFPDISYPIVNAKIENNNNEEYKVFAAFLR